VPEIFVDTSAWYGLADPHEPAHGALARALGDRVRNGALVVTTNLVVAETHALLLRRGGRRAALRFLEEVGREPIVVETSGPELEERALLDWIIRFDDQEFTLTDAVSFAVMNERGIHEALTLDRHFAAAGLTVVPGGPWLALRDAGVRNGDPTNPVREEDWQALP
jgi:predicted nucleic acid-binding protein